MGYTVKEWQKAYKDGKFKSAKRDVQVKAGWYDWFCEDSELAAKTKKLASIITKLKKGGKVDVETDIVLLANEMPASDHPAYDCVSFERDGAPTLLISLDDKRERQKWNVYDIANVYAYAPIFSCGTVAQLAKWMNEPPEESKFGFIDVKLPIASTAIREAVAKDAGVDENKVAMIPITRMYAADRVEGEKWVMKSLNEYDGSIYFAQWGDVKNGGGLIGHSIA